MKTVLLWGDAWWLDDSPAPLPFAGLDEAAEVLGAALGPKRRRLRIIYQPDSLATAATPCPKGSRATLVAALSAAFPALGSPGQAWSHEPILARGDSFSTLLHFEREPGLVTLLAGLTEQGFAVESVWPLATYLSALPDEWSDTGATTVLAVAPGRVCGYRHAADGERSAPAWQGDEALADFGAWLRELLAKSPEEPVLLVGEPETAGALEALVNCEGWPNVQWLSLREALGRKVTLPRSHPAQFLAPAPAVTAQRTVIAASLVFFALAGWSGATYARDVLAWRTTSADREVRKQALRGEVAHLRDNAAEISRMREILARAAVRPPVAALLQKLAATVPKEAACDSLAVTAAGFALNGHFAPSAPAGAGEAWRARLADPGWAVEFKSGRDGAFTASGTFLR